MDKKRHIDGDVYNNCIRGLQIRNFYCGDFTMVMVMPDTGVGRYDSSQSKAKSIDRREVLASLGALSIGSAAGCLSRTGDDGGDEGGDGNEADADSNGDEEPDLDFGGEALNVMINTGKFAQSFQRWGIPRAEEKYNLNINAELAWTSEQTTAITANPENPPDAIMLGRGGIHELAQQDLLVPLGEHSDIVTHYEDIHDQFKWNDGHGAAWELGEVGPLVVTSDGHWSETPDSWDQMFRESDSFALCPFSWAQGPQVLMMAAAVATGEDFGSSNLDIDAGFNYLEEHVAPNQEGTWENTQQLLQMVGNKVADSFLVWIDYIDAELILSDEYDMMRRPDPTGIPYAQSVAVPKNSSNKEAALAYINEALAPDFQETASNFMAQGVTNRNAELGETAKRIGAPTADDFSELTYQDFDYMWDNRDEWAERWSAVFS